MGAPAPQHYCAECKRAVLVLDGHVIRACRCAAPVVGEMRATVRAHSSLSQAAAAGTLAFGRG